MWRKTQWVADKLKLDPTTVRQWVKEGRFDKTTKTPKGQTQFWSVKEDGSDLLKVPD